jgi:hypothetical protein
VRLGKLRVRGEAQPYLEKQLQRKKKELLECYQRGLEADPKLEGEVVLDFFFDKRGKPTTVAVSKSTIRDRHVVDCLQKIRDRHVVDCLQKTVGGWTLEGHGRGVRVLLPLILDPH